MRTRRVLIAATLLAASAAAVAGAVTPEATAPERPEPSAMGALFMGLTPLPPWLDSVTEPTPGPPPAAFLPRLPEKGPSLGALNLTPGVPRFQSETSVAVIGDLVVVGFNDASGFFNPDGISVSGFAWSADGGQNFTYGGQLPVLGGSDAVRGDPDVKAWIDPGTQEVTFVYSSIYRTVSGDNSLCVHVSTDGGQTWDGPREVSPITSSSVFADKEFMDVDPETGRVLLSWTSFGSTLEMRSIYSDDFGLNWAPYTAFASRPEDGQGSCPRFDPTSDAAYIVWRAFGAGEISLVRSTDNGQTWSSPSNIVTGVVTPLPPYGSDRINGFPSLAVSPLDGDLHVVYASRQTADFGDVYYVRSSNFGISWTTPVTLNTNPGNDRAQFFPWISVNEVASERLDAIWYDQRAGTGGSDLTGLVHTHSHDGGQTWDAPTALTGQPFHADYGQDTGQPNIGDYNQCASRAGTQLASFASTGGPSHLTTAPDTYLARNDGTQGQAALRLLDVELVDLGCVTDGRLVAGEIGELRLRLYNDGLQTVGGIAGNLATATTGVLVLEPTASFPDISSLSDDINAVPFLIRLDDTYPCGQDIDFTLSGSSDTGDWILTFSLPTGSLSDETLLLQEDFDATPVGSLPAGWTHTQRQGFDNPWEVSGAYASSGTHSLFCDDVPDTNWSRVSSPPLAIPGDAQLVEVSFRITYQLEDVGDGRQAYDGTLLKIDIDGTDALACAFASLFEGQYPMQIQRSSSSRAAALQDLSCWSGDVLPVFQDVRLQFPGLAGTTIQLAFELSSDIATGGTGFFVDDVRVSSLPLACGPCTATPLLAVTPPELVFPIIPGGQTTCLPITIDNEGDGFLHITGITGCETSPFSLDLSGLDSEVLPLGQTQFQVCATPTIQGPDTCQVSITSDGGNADVRVIYEAVSGAGDGQDLPRSLVLDSVHPNPFNPRVQIRFGLPQEGAVDVAVFDLQGRKVRDLLVGEPLPAGYHELSWEGSDAAGAPAASGVYLFRVRQAGSQRTVRGTLVR
jgi:hypothetical protein